MKAGADAYVNYLSCKGLRHSELQPCFAALALRRQLREFVSSNRSGSSIAALEAILSEHDKPARLPIRNAVDTQSNLSSTVFSDIVGWIGLDPGRYSTKFHLLDKSLLNRRNKIAHGNYLELDVSAFVDLVDQVVQLMRLFKTDIENALATEAFMRSSA